MDVETAEAIQSVIRMIDNVNNRSMLNGLSLDISLAVAASLRRQGLLNDMETSFIDQCFAHTAEDWPEGQAEKARGLLDNALALWRASEPK